MRLPFAAVLVLLIFSRISAGAQLSTSDELRLAFDPAEGNVSELRLGQQSIPLLSGVSGSLSLRRAIPLTTTTLLRDDFSSDAGRWNSAQNANWNTSELYHTFIANGGIGGTPYLQLGNGTMTGAGAAFAERQVVASGSHLRISWAGRTATTSTKSICCVRIFDADGQDITSRSAAPAGWIWSATSAAHVIFGMTNTIPDAWEPFSVHYQVPDGAAYYMLSLRYWNDGVPRVDVDDLTVEQVGGVGFGPEYKLASPVAENGSGLRQEGVFADLALSASVTWKAEPRLLRAQVELQQLAFDAPDLPLRVAWNLPVDASGWTWCHDPMTTQTVEANRLYENTFSTLSRRISIYPWSALTSGDKGIALAVPMDCPRLQRSWWASDTGLATAVDLCLSSRTLHLGSGRATFDFVLYRFDPEWEFRSAAAGYYQRFPQFFQKRTTHEGCWLYPIAPDRIAEPADFGFAFFEGGPLLPAARQLCHDLGITIHRYHEPWNAWQPYGKITEKPPYEIRVETLKAWAAETTTAQWLGAPRHETARAVLASAYTDSQGRYPLDGHSYFWSQWGGVANQLWLCHADPETSPPGIWHIFRDRLIDHRASERDGMYIDSIQADGALGNVEDFTPQHHATVRQPLSFSMKTAAAVIAGPIGHYDYIDWLSRYEHDRGRTIMANIFPYAYRFYAHLLDIAGSEIMNVDESLQAAAHRRFHFYRKANTNLLQWWKGDQFVTHEQVERYILGQLYWGFWPGIASCGGNIGWGNTLERYFLHPELYERDRPLFRKYIPLIRELSRAGWEPIPYGRTSRPEVLMERFGSGPESVLFTLRNTAATTVTARIRVDSQQIGFRPERTGYLDAAELITSRPLTLTAGDGGNSLSWEFDFAPEGFAVVRIRETPTAIPKDEIRLYE